MLCIALGKLPPTARDAIYSARVLASDRPDELDKVRPIARGTFIRRCTSKAVAKVFQPRVAELLQDTEYALGGKRGAEIMHRLVLTNLDVRVEAVKTSFDTASAHQEHERPEAHRSVRTQMPEFLPWVMASLTAQAAHVHVGADGSKTMLPKTRVGDQGYAIIALVFPMTCKQVADETVRIARTIGAAAHIYTSGRC